MTTHDRLIAESGPQRLVVLGEGRVVVDRALTASSRIVSESVSSPEATAFTRPALVAPPGRFRSALAVAGKDLRVEFRTRDIIGSAGLFALAVLITASFTMPTGAASTGAATGVLWISLLFAVLLGVGRTMARESADRGIEGLLLSPVPRDAVFLGKMGASLVLMAAVDVVIVPLFLVMMASNAQGVSPLALLGVVALGTLGLVTVASLFSGIAVGSRLGESMLPLLVMPIVIPLMVGAVQLTGQALGGDSSTVWQWLGILAGFDLMVLIAAVALFRFVIEE
jgi:heme exporter protein B